MINPPRKNLVLSRLNDLPAIFAHSKTNLRIKISFRAEYIDLNRALMARIIRRIYVIHTQRPYAGDLRDVFAGLGPVKVGCTTRQYDHTTGWIPYQPIRIELIPQANVKDARNDRIYPILGVSVRHQLHAAMYLDPDRVRSPLRGLTNNDRETHRRWECCERLPVNVFGQNRLENGLSWLDGVELFLSSLPLQSPIA